MKELIGNALLPVSDTLLKLMAAIPLGLVRMLFLGLLAGLALWAWSLGPQVPGEGDRNFVFLRDLRLFAILLMALQAIPYLIF